MICHLLKIVSISENPFPVFIGYQDEKSNDTQYQNDNQNCIFISKFKIVPRKSPPF